MRSWALVPLLAALGVFALVFHVTPAGWGSVLPECRYKKDTGKNCIGCGGTRAAHSLAHGEVGKAFYYNALLVGAIPLGFLYAGALVFRKRGAKEGGALVTGREVAVLCGGCALAGFVFWYARNQEWFPWY